MIALIQYCGIMGVVSGYRFVTEKLAVGPCPFITKSLKVYREKKKSSKFTLNHSAVLNTPSILIRYLDNNSPTERGKSR